MVKKHLMTLARFAPLILLAACQNLGAPEMVKSKAITLSGQPFVLGAPAGFCLDTPTYQVRRGTLDADTEFANVDASNCTEISGNLRPAPLTHLLTISASPNATPLQNTITALAEANAETWEPWQNGYRIHRQTGGYPAIDYATEINGFLTLIRVTTLDGSDSKNAEDILTQAHLTLDALNS